MKKLMLWFGVLFSAGMLHAQVLEETQPENIQMSSERLQRIDRVIQEYVDSNFIPGLSFYLIEFKLIQEQLKLLLNYLIQILNSSQLLIYSFH